MSDEFHGIFLNDGTTRPLTAAPPPMKATKKLIREVQDALGIPDERATEAADWVADKMERFGARSAQPVFDMDGQGPMCSWCGMVWPLCGHQHQSEETNDESDEE